MPSGRERWLSHFTLRIYEKHHPRSALSLKSAFETIEQQAVVGTLEASQTDQRWIVQMAVLDMKTHPGYASVLFLGIDKEAAERVYGDIKTLNLRTAAKKDTEGAAVSAHLLVNLEPRSGTEDCASLLEEVEGLSRSKITFFLRWLIAKFVEFSDADPENTDPVTPILTSEPIMDKPIGDQLNEAQLIAVDVIAKKKASTIDREAEYYENTRLIEYRPVSRPTGLAAKTMITRILASAPVSDYPETRIRIKEADGAERSVMADRAKQDVLTAAFQLRTFTSGYEPPLEEASNRIAVHLVLKMKQVIEQRLRA